MKSLKRMRKNEKEKFVIPKSVQDVIPIKAVYKDGNFLVGNNLYSKTFKFTDINYNIASDSVVKVLKQLMRLTPNGKTVLSPSSC